MHNAEQFGDKLHLEEGRSTRPGALVREGLLITGVFFGLMIMVKMGVCYQAADTSSTEEIRLRMPFRSKAFLCSSFSGTSHIQQQGSMEISLFFIFHGRLTEKLLALIPRTSLMCMIYLYS